MCKKTDPSYATCHRCTLERIAAELDQREWDADTLDEIADIMRQGGFVIREPGDE